MFDIEYGIRAAELVRRYDGKERSKNIFSSFVVKGRCCPNDLDTLCHMNNSRYLLECDFGRISLTIETGLRDALEQRNKNQNKDINMVVSALQLQYRQSVQLGDQFEIHTRILGWDHRAFYLRQSMILDKNKQTAFVLLARIALTSRSLTPQMLVDDLQIGSIQSPKLEPAVLNFKQNYKLTFEQIKSKL